MDSNLKVCQIKIYYSLKLGHSRSKNDAWISAYLDGKCLYRTRAINRRSQLVAAPKFFKLKRIFYAFLCGNLDLKMTIFDYKQRLIVPRLR